MRATLLAFHVLVLAACTGSQTSASDAGGDGSIHPDEVDGSIDSGLTETTEASSRQWCEDGEVFEARLKDLSHPGGEACSTTDPDRWESAPDRVFTCPHGCAPSDAGPSCVSCYGHDGGLADCPPPGELCAPLGPHCDSVMYWCEEGQVFQGYINHATYPTCGGPASCSIHHPNDWAPVQAVGNCPSGCQAFDGGEGCEYWDAIGGLAGSYPEAAGARLCAH